MGKILILFSLIVLPTASMAHGDHGPADDKQLEATFELFENIVELTPFIASEDDTGADSEASVRIGKTTIQFNGALWELARGWIRLSYREAQEECDHCIADSEEVFLRKAEDVAGPSFMERQVGGPVRRAAEDIVVNTADIGAQLGKTALVAKVASEAGETVLSKLIGGGGVHVICNVIDAFLIFGLRSAQELTRIYSWAPRFGGNSLWTLLKADWFRSVAHRVERRVQFQVEPVEIDSETLAEVDAEGAKGSNRWWGLVKEGKRYKWLSRFTSRSEQTLNTREFRGTRMKRYLFLKRRRRGHSQFMAGNTSMDKRLTEPTLWILAVQENMIRRGLNAKLPPEEITQLEKEAAAAQPQPEFNEVLHYLADEYSQGDPTKAQVLEGILRDVDAVFEPTASLKVRKYRALVLESLVSHFVYNAYKDVLAAKGALYGRSWKGLWNQVKFRLKLGKLAIYMYKWSDFLKTGALVKSRSDLASGKYEAMESLLKIFEYLKESKSLLEAESREELLPIAENLGGKLETLQKFTPWQEKRVASWWLPWGFGKPRCEDLSERAD